MTSPADSSIPRRAHPVIGVRPDTLIQSSSMCESELAMFTGIFFAYV